MNKLTDAAFTPCVQAGGTVPGKEMDGVGTGQNEVRRFVDGGMA